jgi:diguanylate cyclase (GGDEF)-like protein
LSLGHSIPPIFSDGRTFTQAGFWWAVPSGLFFLAMAALVSILSLRSRSPERLWLSVGVLAAVIDIWLHWQGTNRFSLGFYAAKSISILTSLSVLLSKLQQITQLYAESASHNKRLIELVHKDGLTGLSNRRRFDELLVQEFNRACRNASPLGLILIDVDWFKSYNDTYGHLSGDECLRLVAGGVSGELKRPGDEAARYGGEEMVVLLPSTDRLGALKVAQQMCDAVAALGITHAGSTYGKVTISAGVSILTSFENTLPGDLVGAADKALYRAKNEGRNRVSSIELCDLIGKLCA